MPLQASSTKAPGTLASRLGKHICIVAAISISAFLLANLAASGSDRSGYGMVMFGLMVLGAPFFPCAGALAFVFRRTIIADVLNAVSLFLAVFLLTTAGMH